MSTITLTIQTPKAASDFSKTGQARTNMIRLLKLLNGIKLGSIPGGIFLQTSTADPVAAVSTATITYASLADGDTIVILGVTLTCRTGTPTTNEYQKITDATATAVNLVNLINANTTLSKYVTASSALGVVTITSNLRGAIGNFLTAITRTGTGIALVAWANGAGGPSTTPLQIRG